MILFEVENKRKIKSKKYILEGKNRMERKKEKMEFWVGSREKEREKESMEEMKRRIVVEKCRGVLEIG